MKFILNVKTKPELFLYSYRGDNVMCSTNIVEESLRMNYAQLTPSQKKLADYIFQNPYEVALMSNAQLALLLDVSEATVVRFAQAIGFDGYLALKEKLRAQVIKEVNSSERVATVIHKSGDSLGPLHEVVMQNIYNLNRLLENVSEEAIADVIECLDSANQIIVYGEGAPGALTYHVDFWFSRLGYKVKSTTQTGRRFYDHIFNVDKNDVALVLAFRRSTSEALALLEVMNERNGKSILMTDLVSSKMHSFASHVLMVQRGPMDSFRSLGPVTIVLDALILGLMRRKGDEGVETLRYLDEIRGRYGVLYDK